MGVIGMSRLFENFLSNQWNIYGLQVLCVSLLIMILHNYLTFMGMLCVGLCVYLIAISQRILGVRYGMLFYETNKNKLDYLVKKLKKMNEEDEDAGK